MRASCSPRQARRRTLPPPESSSSMCWGTLRELGYDIRMVSPEEEERELFDSFNIDLEIGVDT